MENTSNRIETCKINYRRLPLSSRFGESFSTIGITAEDEDRSTALKEQKRKGEKWRELRFDPLIFKPFRNSGPYLLTNSRKKIFSFFFKIVLLPSEITIKASRVQIYYNTFVIFFHTNHKLDNKIKIYSIVVYNGRYCSKTL